MQKNTSEKCEPSEHTRDLLLNKVTMLVLTLYGESILTSLQRRCLFFDSVVVVISLVVIRCLWLFRCRCHSSDL